MCFNYNDDNEFFLQCTGNTNQRGWGQSGVNGADCHFTGISQDMQGDVIWDSISDLDFYLTEGSSLTGAVVDDESYAGEGGEGYCNVYVSADSTWTVTGDSTVSSLENEGTIVDGNGKTVTIQGTDGTVYVQGDSEYTVTVDCDVIQADGGTRTASITGAWVALHDALAMWVEAGKIERIPLIGQVAAISMGVVDGNTLLDLDYSEDSHAEVDMNLVATDTGEMIELQGTGEQAPFDRKRLNALLDLGDKGIAELIELQRQAIA